MAKLAQLTGKRWPVVGRRLHEDYPYIEAEVGEHHRVNKEEEKNELMHDLYQANTKAHST